MLNGITLFFILFILWIFSTLFIHITPFFIFLGLFVTAFIAFISWRLGLVNSKTSFMVLQFGFYKFFFKKLTETSCRIIKLSLQFLNPKYKFAPILDYVFLNKDNDAEVALVVNLIIALPGTICVAIKKRYIIVHSVGKEYFSSDEMYEISNQVGKVYDDSL
jgi:multisubunit Na+/H+ antiporter MnhE subunit